MKYNLESMLPLNAFQPRGKGPFSYGMTLEGGGGGDVVSVVTAVVAVAASVVAGPEVGAAIVESMGVTDASAATVAAVGSAAIGGSTSAVNSAIQGGNVEDVLKAGAIGAASGAVGSEVSSAVTPGVTDVTGSTAAGNIAGGTARGAASGFTGSELSGQNLNQSLKNAEIGGATGAITSGISETANALGANPDVTKYTLAAAGPYIRQDVSSLFNPSTTPTTPGSSGSSGSQLTNFPSALAGTTPSASALGQALNVGGGEVNPPVQIGGDQTSRNVWNQASLRSTDSGSSS